MSEEEAARANLYGLAARLFAAPADAALLAALAAAGPLEAEEGPLAEAWQGLARAAQATDPEAAREAHDGLFVGLGKAPVTVYASAYVARFSSEMPLAALRSELARLGLARRSNVHEPEDHVAALCEVMRHLIAEPRFDLAQQKAFFLRWIWPIVSPLCDAIEGAGQDAFYRAVAKFFRAFCTVEHRSFEML